MGVRKFDRHDEVFKDFIVRTFVFDLITNRVRFKEDYTYKAGFRVTTIPAWRVFTNNIVKGYYLGTIGGVTLTEHQIAWLLIHGEWCDAEIDHEDGNRINNSPLNMRRVTTQENSRNRAIQSNNTSGIPGVSFDINKNKWIVIIGSGGGKRIYIGQFDSFEVAVAERLKAQRELGYHQNHGRLENGVTNR